MLWREDVGLVRNRPGISAWTASRQLTPCPCRYSLYVPSPHRSIVSLQYSESIELSIVCRQLRILVGLYKMAHVFTNECLLRYPRLPAVKPHHVQILVVALRRLFHPVPVPSPQLHGRSWGNAQMPPLLHSFLIIKYEFFRSFVECLHMCRRFLRYTERAL